MQDAQAAYAQNRQLPGLIHVASLAFDSESSVDQRLVRGHTHREGLYAFAPATYFSFSLASMTWRVLSTFAW